MTKKKRELKTSKYTPGERATAYLYDGHGQQVLRIGNYPVPHNHGLAGCAKFAVRDMGAWHKSLSSPNYTIRILEPGRSEPTHVVKVHEIKKARLPGLRRPPKPEFCGGEGCTLVGCPQLRDNEPQSGGRKCPIPPLPDYMKGEANDQSARTARSE